jgi:hypothetical protein
VSIARQPPEGSPALSSLFGTAFPEPTAQSADSTIPAGIAGTVSDDSVQRNGTTWWPVCFDDEQFGCSWCPAGTLTRQEATAGLALDATQQTETFAAGQQFGLDQRVRTVSSATVRDSPTFDAPGQSVSQGTIGRIRDSAAGDPYPWWRVEFPATTGWIVQPYLEAAPNSEVDPASVRGTFVQPPRDLGTMKAMLDRYDSLGVNRVMLSIFTRGETIYPSNYVTDKQYPEGFLTETIQYAHDRGIEIHGWLHNMYLWNLEYLGDLPDGHLLEGSEQICGNGNCLSVDRDLITETRSGRVTAEGGKVFGSPFSSRLRQTIANVAREADQRFDLDGIMFDYVRFPKSTESFGFGPAADYSGRLSGRARREQAVTTMVAEAANAVSPATTTSAAVFPSYYTKNTRSENNKAQDWRTWRYDTPVDEFVPMCYGLSTYDSQLAFCESVLDGQHPIHPALAITKGHEPLQTQLDAWSDYDFSGYLVWKGTEIERELP